MRMTGCRRLQFAKFNSCQCNISWPLGFDHDIFKFIFDACMTIIASAHNYIIWVIAAVISIGKYQGGTFGSVFGPLSPQWRVLFFPLKSKFLSNFFLQNKITEFTLSKVCLCAPAGGVVIIWLDGLCSSWFDSVSADSITFTFWRFLEKRLKQHRWRVILRLKGWSAKIERGRGTQNSHFSLIIDR